MRLRIAHVALNLQLLVSVCCSTSFASDYFLTLGGGYAPQANQASLEANVLFFQQVLAIRQLSGEPHRIYFADGFDDQQDVQVLKKNPPNSSPVISQLSSIFRRDRDELIYRNHQVAKISGGIRITEIREELRSISDQLRSGDRLFVYVTAHGGSARKGEGQNTSITCWGNKPLSMTEFSRWLDDLPADVSVVSVMAQCYCGGFANTIFQGGDPGNGFAANNRCGFFAQQADLPAAGCRPDVENDEEYSSYFWGAFAGHSRTGNSVGNVDCDKNGRVSLAEAHAYATVASNTIDIPLRTSDLLLRRYSRIAGYDIARFEAKHEELAVRNEVYETPQINSSPTLAYLSGTIYDVAARGRPDETRMIIGLAEKLDVPVSMTVTELTELYEQQKLVLSDARRSGPRRGRGFSSRRRLMASIIEKWPELEDPKQWANSPLLAEANQAAFADELQQLPDYSAYMKMQDEREAAQTRVTDAELREVKFRRILQQLESIVLAQNLALVAAPEIVEHFHRIREAEEGYFGNS